MAEEQISVVLKANIDNYNKNMSIAASVLKDLQKQSAEFTKINNGVENSFIKIEFAAKRFGETAGVLEKKLVVIKKAMTDLVVAGQENTRAFKDLDNQYKIITNRLENKAMAEAQAYAQANMTNMALPKTAKTLDDVGKSVKKSGQLWTSLALVVQDLPYGFRGIQNNLPALVGSFAAATGAIYLGFSILIAITTAYEKEITELIYGINGLGIATKKMNEAVAEQVGNSKSQIASDQALIKIINDTTKSTEERTRALSILKEEYKGNVELQKIDINDGAKLAEVYNKISNALIRKAKSTAYASLIAEEESKVLKLQSQQGEEVVKNLGFMGTVYGLATGGALGLNSASNIVSSAFSKQAKEIKQSQSNIELYTKKLQENTDEAIKNADAQSIDTTAISNKGKSAKIKADKMAGKVAARIAKGVALAGGDIQPIAEPLPKQDKGDLDKQIKILDETSKTRIGIIKEQYQTEVSLAEGSFEKIKQAQSNMRARLDEEFKAGLIGTVQYSQAIQDLIQKQNDTIYQQYKANFENLLQIGNGIMSALGGALDMLIDKGANLGDVLVEAFKSILKQLTKVIVSAAIAVLLISILFPGKLAEAGGAMKLFGGLFSQGMGLGKNLFAAPTANGGVFSGPSYRLVGEYPGAKNNPEVVAPLDKLKSMIGGGGSGEFVLRGNDLVLALQRSNSSLTLRR